MRNVALLGGGCDPISIHHEALVDAVVEHTGMPVWVMPCYGHLFDKGRRLTEVEHRWNMVVKSTAQQNKGLLIPFDWEIENSHTGSMYETITQLKLEYPDRLFHVVIGMDNANVIESKWDRGSLLIQENPFIVFEREGIKPEVSWFMQSPHRIYPMKCNLSSTAIRDAIKNGDYNFAQNHLNPAVWDYIQANKLYGYKA